MVSRGFLSLFAVVALSACLSAQGIPPYTNAITDRLFHGKTPMAPPAANAVFTDPDLGSTMVRVTDQTSDPRGKGRPFHNPPEDVNEWSMDNSKFYVSYGDGPLAFSFDPSSMTIGPLPGAGPGGGLLVPLQPGPTFSFTDRDLMYGAVHRKPLIIATYRFSTAEVQPLFDTTNCGTVPSLAGPGNSSTDTTISTDDSRIEISAGGKAVGHRPFVIVYDKRKGCRWYNTETGQIGGQWGPTGQASTPDRFAVNHSRISGNGRFVRIGVAKTGFYVWDVESLNVTPCLVHGGLHCSGYGAIGYKTFINGPGVLDELNTYRRPLHNLPAWTQLINPLPQPYYWGMEVNYGWSNGRLNDNVPVCGSLYSPTGGMEVAQPYDGEIFCIETDGIRSTVWRFAHNRAVWYPEYFWTQPYANTSLDGGFFSFTSSWDNELGNVPGSNDPRTDVWIVKLD